MPLDPQTRESVLFELSMREDKHQYSLPGPDDPLYEFSGRYYYKSQFAAILMRASRVEGLVKVVSF
jgi:hypothetical protein